MEETNGGSQKYDIGGSQKYREVTKSDSWAWQNRPGKNFYGSQTARKVDWKKFTKGVGKNWLHSHNLERSY